jgi:hypothetical protein
MHKKHVHRNNGRLKHCCKKPQHHGGNSCPNVLHDKDMDEAVCHRTYQLPPCLELPLEGLQMTLQIPHNQSLVDCYFHSNPRFTVLTWDLFDCKRNYCTLSPRVHPISTLTLSTLRQGKGYLCSYKLNQVCKAYQSTTVARYHVEDGVIQGLHWCITAQRASNAFIACFTHTALDRRHLQTPCYVLPTPLPMPATLAFPEGSGDITPW